MVVFFVKSNENTYPKGRALMQIYRVVPITKRGNSVISDHVRWPLSLSSTNGEVKGFLVLN